MVERPIKKSERLAKSAEDATSASPDQSPTESSAALPDGFKPSSAPRPAKKGDAPRDDAKPAEREKRGKRNDRGKKSDDKKDAPPINPALMRGPRPPKPSAAQPEPEIPADAEPSEAETES
ncbi:hypothetical protein [Leptolyngbya sp. FACHB-17]|uniref:hypothetical protein n=1 Tax=Leptolyngbya sp. FACHB-17 TaxID=2692803 RepID=UPI0016814DA1|nr:hypothetical protein [Leptolyngbya sp. FACHB-17]MBD2082929.1 hypothetical protein [Leptolyngbya sp. FACHB-17]